MTDYASRIRLPLVGDDTTNFFTRSGSRLAIGYDRIVVGTRGPYVEFDISQLNQEIINSTDVEHYYYIELRTFPDNVKIYVQLHRVDYADYLPEKCYVSPFELFNSSGEVLIDKLKSS